MNRDTHSYIRLLRASFSLTLNISRDGASITILAILFQCLITLIVKKKKIFLISNLNLPSVILKPFPLVLSQETVLKNLSLSFL